MNSNIPHFIPWEIIYDLLMSTKKNFPYPINIWNVWIMANDSPVHVFYFHFFDSLCN